MTANLRRGFLAALLCCALAPAAWAATPAVEEAQALMTQGQFGEALKRLDVHLAGSPQDAEARFLRGLALVKLARTDDALKAFAELTRDYPQLPEPYNNLAVLYAQQGDYEKARDALEAALATHPSYATAHENLGDIYAALAGAAYNRALMLDQNNPTVRSKLNLISQLDSLQGSVANQARAPAELRDQPAGTPVTGGDADAVTAAVFDWAAAWSAKNSDRYLAAYAPDFVPDGGLSRTDWMQQRRERIARPSRISVKVLSPQVASDGAVMRVTFYQEYESDLLTNKVTKVLEMKNYGGAWKILREYSR